MGLIRDLISSYASSRIDEQRQKMQQRAQIADWVKDIAVNSPDAGQRNMANLYLQGMLTEHGGKRGKEMAPQIGAMLSQANTMKTIQSLAGQNTDDPGAPGQDTGGAPEGATGPLGTGGQAGIIRSGAQPQQPSRFRPVLRTLAGVGRGVGEAGRAMVAGPRDLGVAQLPEGLRLPSEDEREQRKFEVTQQQEDREAEARRARGQKIGLSGEALDAYALTGRLPTRFGEAERLHYDTLDGDDDELRAYLPSAKAGTRYRVSFNEDGKIVDAHVAGTQAAVPERKDLVSGSDPQVQGWLDIVAPGTKADPNKSYNITFRGDRPLRVEQAGTTSTSADRTVWSQYFRTAKAKYQQADGSPISDAQAAELASDWFMQDRGVHISNIQQQEFLRTELSGVGAGPGLTTPRIPGVVPVGGAPRPAAQPGATPGAAPPATPAAAPGAPTAKPQAPATALPATATPGAAPAAAAGKKLTPRDQQLVTQYLNSVGRVGPPSGGTAGTLGELKGQQFLMNATGLDPSSLTVAATEYNANLKALNSAVQTYGGMDRFIREVDNFGKQFLDYGKKITDLGSEWANTPLRDVGPKIFANPALRQYQVAINPLQGAYAAIRSNAAQSRAQLPQRMQEHIDTLLSPNVTLQEAQAQVQAIQTEGRLMVQSLQEQQDDIKGKIAANPIGKALGATPPPARDSGVRSRNANEYRKNHPDLFPAK